MDKIYKKCEYCKKWFTPKEKGDILFCSDEHKRLSSALWWWGFVPLFKD